MDDKLLQYIYELLKNLDNIILFIYLFLRQGFSVALEPELELTPVDQAGLELTELRLPLPPESWDERHALPLPG